MTWKDLSDKIQFSIKAEIPSLSADGDWVSLGLSDDKQMVGTCYRLVVFGGYMQDSCWLLKLFFYTAAVNLQLYEMWIFVELTIKVNS